MGQGTTKKDFQHVKDTLISLWIFTDEYASFPVPHTQKISPANTFPPFPLDTTSAVSKTKP